MARIQDENLTQPNECFFHGAVVEENEMKVTSRTVDGVVIQQEQIQRKAAQLRSDDGQLIASICLDCLTQIKNQLF